MTPDRADQLATRWFIAALAVLVLRVGLEMFGFDEFALPLSMLTMLGFGLSMSRSGWANGYRTRAAETTREDA